MINITNLNKYLDLKYKLLLLYESLNELEEKINNFGYKSTQIDLLPKSTVSFDSMDLYIKLLADKEQILNDIRRVKHFIRLEKKALKRCFKGFKNETKTKIYELKYIEGLTFKEIAKKLNKSYWCIIKTYKRP